MFALSFAKRAAAMRRLCPTLIWRAPWLRGGRGFLHALFFALTIAALTQGAPAQAATEIHALIDSDNNAATGCTVATPGGAFGGVEQVAITRIDLLAADPVGDVTREVCQSGVVVADPSFVPSAPLWWPVGIAAAGIHTDVVESYAQLVGASTTVRMGFVISTTDGSVAPTALLSTMGGGGGPILLAAAMAVPALGGAGLLLVAGALVFATYRFARVRRHAATGVTMCLLVVVSLAWAAIVRDGSPSDWGSTPPVATSATTGPHQLAAVYGRLEGRTLQLRYDLDLGVRDGGPQDDGPYATTVGNPLSVPAPGLLGNDALGTPPLQVREFRVQGAASNTPAGGVVAFAGNSLTVAPDGGFTVGAPTLAGTYRFEYHAHNRLTAGGWGVATVEVAAADVCGDGLRTGAEVCDDGNAVTETSCPYGVVSCTACNATCSANLSLAGQFCGDSIRTGAEVCDDGDNVTETSCPYGEANCSACNATCTATLSLTGGICGDGIRTGAEVCDDGNNVTEASCPDGVASCSACNATCTASLSLSGAICGDGIRNGAEVCDDGNNLTETSCPYGSPSCMTCNASCTATLLLTGGYCGDGVVNGGEVCDGTPGCSAMCTPL
jgi:cysteine-rich repeat protein